MVSVVHEICHMDSQDLVEPIFHPYVANASVSSTTGVVEVVVKLVLRPEPLHVLTICDKVLRFALCNKSFPVIFSQLFVRTEGALLFPPKLHKPTLVGPSRTRDDLHSYLLPLLL
jgi:hypothetical protein